MNTTTPLIVQVTQRFSAPPERVYDAWLDPDWIRDWMFGKRFRDEEVLRVVIDAQVGGAFSFLVRRDGQKLDHVGHYLDLDRPSRLAFNWAVSVDAAPPDASLSRVTLSITPTEGGAELTLTHEMDRKWESLAERATYGWTTILNSFAAGLGE